MKSKVFLTTISIVLVMVASFVMIVGSSDVISSVDAADGEAEASITYSGENGEITETGMFSEIVNKAASYDSSKIVLTKSGTFSKTGSSGSLWTVSNDVILDLHGYELSLSGGLYAITVSKDVSFVLTDSVGTGMISASGNYYRVINGSGGSSITIDADISYDTTRTQKAEVVYVVGTASTFKMTGGSITLTGAVEESSALNAYSGSFEITGGTITSQGTGTYAVNTSSYTNMDITEVNIVGIFNVPKSCSVTISGGSFSVAPDFSKISIAEGKIATISESEGMSITDDVPSNPTASVGNVYYIDAGGRNDALAASVAAHNVTIYDAPENWTGTIHLLVMGDYVDVTMSNCDTSASISVTTIDSCTVQITDLGNDTKRYTAMIVPASAGAMIKETQAYYPSFNEAFDVLESGQTIVLLKDHTMSSVLYVAEDMTLDLNGKTLVVVSNGNSSGITVGDCRFTITDSSDGYSLMVDETTNNVTYEGGKVVYNGEVNNGAIYSQSFSSEIVLDKGKLESTNARAISINGHVTINDFYISTGMDAIYITGRGMSYDPTTLSITGGVIESSYGMVISGNGTKSAMGDYSNTSIEISGGLIHATSTENFSTAIYHPQYGTLSITGGRILVENGAGIVMRSGDLNITGGEIVSKGTTSGSVGDAGNAVQPSAVVIDGSADYPGVEEGFNTDIIGGSFESDSGIPTISETKISTDDESTVDVTGGTFQSGGVMDSSIEDFINPVYTIDSETGEVSFDESKVVATVGNDSYASLQEAIDAAQDDQIVSLLKDVSEDVTIVDKDITLDLGVSKITGVSTTGAVTIENGSIITITATSGGIEGGITSVFAKSGSTVTINGGNYSGTYGLVADGQTTSIKVADGTITGTSAGVAVQHMSTVTVSGGSVNGNYGATMLSDGETSSGHIEITGDANVSGTDVGVFVYGYGSSLTVSGGNISGGTYAISGNGTYDGSEITISGGNITSEDGFVMYHPQEGDLTITGGTMSGYNGIYFSGTGTIQISGGSITATADVDGPTKDPSEGDGPAVDGAALSMVSRGGGYQDGGNTIELGITGGTFTSLHGSAIADYRLQKVDGQWAINESTDIEQSYVGSVSISGDAVVSGASDKPAISVDDLSGDAYAISGGLFSSDVSDYAADGYAVIPSADGTYGAVEADTPEGVTITENGQTVIHETDGNVITIPSDGQFSEVTLNLGFGDVGITIFGDVTSNITVSYDPSIETDGANIAFNLHIAGIDSTDMSVIIVIPVTLPSGYSIDADSVYAYSIIGEVRLDEYAYASGDSIIIETTHNTPFYVSYEVESDQPFIPFPDDDDDYVPLPPHIVYEDEGGSDDSVKIAACAAAAVIAAILAIVLATTYRRR